MADRIRLIFYTDLLARCFSKSVSVIKWWIMDEELYWQYEIRERKEKWLHETFHWGPSGRMDWNEISGFESLNKLINPLLLYSWKRKNMLALGSNLRLHGIQNNLRFQMLVINVILTIKDLFPWKMITYLYICHKGSLMIQGRKMQVRVRLPGLTLPSFRIHKFKELWQELYRSNICNAWKKPLTTQRFVTWLNCIQTSGSFGYNCFLIKQVIWFYVFLKTSFSTSTCKFRTVFVRVLFGYGLASWSI